MQISAEALARFSWSMVTCLKAGLPICKSLTLGAETSGSKRLERIMREASNACEQGSSVSDALSNRARCFPDYFLPVLRAGEISGRHVESFQLVYERYERLKSTLEIVRKTWLYPLIIISCGWIFRIGLLLYFGLNSAAWNLMQQIGSSVSLTLLIGWLAVRWRPTKEILHFLLLQLPWVRQVQTRLGLILFFSTFRLVYSAGEIPVVTMLDMALASVSNLALRRDLMTAREVVADGGTFDEAFNAPWQLTEDTKSSLAIGALSGHLEKTLGQIVKTLSRELELSLELFNRLFMRILAYSVTLSIVGTLLICLSSFQGR